MFSLLLTVTCLVFILQILFAGLVRGILVSFSCCPPDCFVPFRTIPLRPPVPSWHWPGPRMLDHLEDHRLETIDLWAAIYGFLVKHGHFDYLLLIGSGFDPFWTGWENCWGGRLWGWWHRPQSLPAPTNNPPAAAIPIHHPGPRLRTTIFFSSCVSTGCFCFFDSSFTFVIFYNACI